MFYVVDTHAFLLYLADDPRLGRNASQAFDDAEHGLQL
jgi:PIN domain nuclease of toxin-antitoxin system